MTNKTCTGLRDSNGTLIKVSDHIKMPSDINEEFHGKWSVYEVIQRGLTPILSYLHSEKGQMLAKGYSAAPLCNFYDTKLFCTTEDSTTLSPVDELYVIETASEAQ